MFANVIVASELAAKVFAGGRRTNERNGEQTDRIRCCNLVTADSFDFKLVCRNTLNVH